VVAQDPDTGTLVLAMDEGGVHAAEGLILARYMMFTQVYFHHVRGAYDHHLAETLKELLREENKDRAELGDEKGTFLPPTTPETRLVPLSQISDVVKGLTSLNQRRLYAPYEKATEARKIVDECLTEKRKKEKEKQKQAMKGAGG